MTRKSHLEEFGDAEGSVALGWVDTGVLYSRFTGGISAGLGGAYAARLQVFAEEGDSVRLYCDVSALKHYDLLARSAFVRVVMAHRRTFDSMVFHMFGTSVSPVAKAFATVLGDGVEFVFDAAEFENKLLRVAPLARHHLDPKTWVRRPLTAMKA